ncbi:MAG: hypothetical protein ACYDHX_04125 [Methanothrix sp.]
MHELKEEARPSWYLGPIPTLTVWGTPSICDLYEASRYNCISCRFMRGEPPLSRHSPRLLDDLKWTLDMAELQWSAEEISQELCRVGSQGGLELQVLRGCGLGGAAGWQESGRA